MYLFESYGWSFDSRLHERGFKICGKGNVMDWVSRGREVGGSLGKGTSSYLEGCWD